MEAAGDHHHPHPPSSALYSFQINYQEPGIVPITTPHFQINMQFSWYRAMRSSSPPWNRKPRGALFPVPMLLGDPGRQLDRPRPFRTSCRQRQSSRPMAGANGASQYSRYTERKVPWKLRLLCRKRHLRVWRRAQSWPPPTLQREVLGAEVSTLPILRVHA